jgi:hypothetical protein
MIRAKELAVISLILILAISFQMWSDYDPPSPEVEAFFWGQDKTLEIHNNLGFALAGLAQDL